MRGNVFAIENMSSGALISLQVVLTNEITTRIINADTKYIAPALGDGLSHRMHYQITLGRDLNDKELFYANIDKSFYCREIMVPFRVRPFLTFISIFDYFFPYILILYLQITKSGIGSHENRKDLSNT